MLLSAIVAASENNAIGKGNQLPWHLPDDLRFFKKTTMNKPVLMGRKTFESLGKPLPGRFNVVVSHRQNLKLPEGAELCNDLSTALKLLQRQGTGEGFVIGGGRIFEETLAKLDRIYLTRVHTIIENATAFFPPLDHTHWKKSWEQFHPEDEKHAYSFTFQQLERTAL